MQLGRHQSITDGSSLTKTYKIQTFNLIQAWVERVYTFLIFKQSIGIFLTLNRLTWWCTCKKTFKIPNMLLFTTEHSVIKQGWELALLLKCLVAWLFSLIIGVNNWIIPALVASWRVLLIEKSVLRRQCMWEENFLQNTAFSLL